MYLISAPKSATYLIQSRRHIFSFAQYTCLDPASVTIMADSDEEMYTVPLRDQRYFGAGIKRKRVQFVPSSSNVTGNAPPPADGSATSASARYLSIVMKTQSEPPSAPVTQTPKHIDIPSSDHAPVKDPEVDQQQSQETDRRQPATTCPVCNLSFNSADSSNTHESSLVHQVCLPHSHPPSALDRKRKGITMLQFYGWDPDKRVGLGASGEGILHPIKAKEKRDTVGLGVGREDELQGRKRGKAKEQPKKVEKLDAGKIRKLEMEEKKRDQRLREMFYANEDVQKYLGGG